MSRWDPVDVAKGLAIVGLAFGIANLWLTESPHFEGLGGPYNDTDDARFIARLASSTIPPTFFLLSGVVVGKRLTRQDDRPRWVQHLFSRGLFLVILELAATQLYNISHPGPDYLVIFEVLSAFGWGFVVLAVLSRLSAKAWGWLAVVLWLAPELVLALGLELPRPTFALAALFTASDQPPWLVEYPLLSWLPFLLLGGAAGQRWAKLGLPSTSRFALFGVAAMLVFVVLRATTTFGTLGQVAPANLQQFFSPTKYPASLQYALWGLGGASAALALASAMGEHAIRRGLRILGRQPLAAYILIKLVVGVVQVLFDVRGRWGGLFPAATVATLTIAILIPTLAAYDRLKRRAAGRFLVLRLL